LYFGNPDPHRVEVERRGESALSIAVESSKRTSLASIQPLPLLVFLIQVTRPSILMTFEIRLISHLPTFQHFPRRRPTLGLAQTPPYDLCCDDGTIPLPTNQNVLSLTESADVGGISAQILGAVRGITPNGGCGGMGGGLI